MNRAWIPAGALAGVSVAGLIALGALTDSLGTPVPFQTSVEVTTQAGSPSKSVPVSYTKGNAGSTVTANLTVRGGAAVSIAPDTSGNAGYTGYRKYTPVKVASPPPPAKETSPPAKTKKRTQLGTTAAPNTNAGLTGGGSSSTTGSGEQSGTPSSAGQ